MPAGHLTRPAGGVIRNFLKCTPEDYHENHQVGFEISIHTQCVRLRGAWQPDALFMTNKSTRCAPPQVKSIVNTQFAHLPTTDPHHFAYKEGKYAVNTAFEKVDGAVNVAIRCVGVGVLWWWCVHARVRLRMRLRARSGSVCPASTRSAGPPPRELGGGAPIWMAAAAIGAWALRACYF